MHPSQVIPLALAVDGAQVILQERLISDPRHGPDLSARVLVSTSLDSIFNEFKGKEGRVCPSRWTSPEGLFMMKELCPSLLVAGVAPLWDSGRKGTVSWQPSL